MILNEDQLVVLSLLHIHLIQDDMDNDRVLNSNAIEILGKIIVNEEI